MILAEKYPDKQKIDSGKKIYPENYQDKKSISITPAQFFNEISEKKNIYIETSGGYHSSNTVLEFYELGYKNVFLIHNDTKLQYIECLDNIHRLIEITDYPIVFITPFHKRNISDIMKESFSNIENARGKHNYRDYFSCCRVLKKQASKSWNNKNLLDNSIVISSLTPYESFNRQMTLFELKKSNSFVRFHKTQNCYKGYPYRDLLHGNRRYSRKIYEPLFEQKLRQYNLNIKHSGCRICPIRILFPEMLEENDCSIRYNKIQWSLE